MKGRENMVSAKPKPLGLDQGLVTAAHTDNIQVIGAQLMKRTNDFSAAAGNAIGFELIRIDDRSGYVVEWARLHALASSEAAGMKLANMKGISVQPTLVKKEFH